MNIDLNEFIIFEAVVSQGSFTQAALYLDIPKGNVSRKIAQLESRLGVTLLLRDSRNMKVTETGQSFYKYCHNILQLSQNAENSIGELQDEVKGLLRIAMPLSFDTHFMLNTIKKFCKIYPGIQIDLQLDDRNLNLIKEGLDITFRSGPLPNSSFIATLIAKIPLVLCATPHYLKSTFTPDNPQSLIEHNLIGHRKFIPWVFSSEDTFSTTPKYTSNDMGCIYRMVLNHMGIGSVPLILCADDIQSGRLVHIIPQLQLTSSNIYMVYPSRDELAMKVKLFKDFFVKESHQQLPWAWPN